MPLTACTGYASGLSGPLPIPEGGPEGLLGPTWLPGREEEQPCLSQEPRKRSSASSEWPGVTRTLLEGSHRELAT